MDRWLNGWQIDECLVGWMMDGWIMEDRWTDIWMDKWMDGQMDGGMAKYE